ncbi:MAG: 4Fe-4S binding protein [Candidatus Omnitrophota bacterium]
MVKIKIDTQKCKGCGLCVLYCPKKILCFSEKLNKKGVKPVEIKKEDESKCTGCATCAIVCPDCAIQIVNGE